MPNVIDTATAKTHLRVFHDLDDAYIDTLCKVAQEEWETVTKMLLDSNSAEQTIRYDESPADGLFRFHFWPVATDPQPFFTGDDEVVTELGDYVRELDLWQVIDATDLIDDGTLEFPGVLTYQTLYEVSTVPESIKHCLLMRIGSLYSYRGDDVQPPNIEQWKLLAARWRKGGLL